MLAVELTCACCYEHNPDFNSQTVSEAEKCVGGLPALKKLMDDRRANNTQSIWLNAGNTLGGDLFRTLKFDTALEAMHLLNFSAMVSC
jgi:2',3'-cyclic-nucleotide 2'-phosphodiesterase (5'-nucleotidase family)